MTQSAPQFSQKIEPSKLTREFIQGLPPNLISIHRVLKEAFKMVESDEQMSSLTPDDTVVVTVGMTGSGKSTLVNSLLFGSDALHLTPIFDDINLMRRNGETQ